MPFMLTRKGRITIPERIRDAFNFKPGCIIDFSVNRDGDVVIRKADSCSDRFEAARGKADIKWRTDDLMVLLRGED